MRVKVRYEQEYCYAIGAYKLIRIIEPISNNIISIGDIRQDVCNAADLGTHRYTKKVKNILNYTERNLNRAVKGALKEWVNSPEYISDDIEVYETETEVDVGGIKW